MLPRLSPEFTVEKTYQDYLFALKNTAFSGDIRTDYAVRLAVATDNSVYQVIPQAVILPKTTQDISIALQLCQQQVFSHIQFSPRGGGTGTNGQSLTQGIIIDCSQYMREIGEVNLVERWVRVQPGVVLDQLNAFLALHGMHFAPEISPSNRATIGGMINTDACGNGSKVIGRTSDHVINLTCVLSDGQIIQTSDIDEADPYAKEIIELLLPKQSLIHEKFRHRPRNLNGYNLLKTYTNKINFNYLFCGSEGTLGIIGECKLRISPLPKFKKLVLVKYRCFDDALRSHDLLEKSRPLVVESIDEKLLELAREDAIYFRLKNMLDGDVVSGAVNLVEFVAETEAELSHAVQLLCSEVESSNQAIGYYVAKDTAETKLLWELRKKSVGLISKRQQGTRRPIPFVEDTAVPPERLADYIAEFKNILDKHNLIYGMYGHVDAGCVHVRPALDLKLLDDKKLFQEISNEVAQLVEHFGGVMWGEHGMGFRCHYAEHFFGKELYLVVRQIKTLFDPQGRLNPGKIATPFNSDQNLVNLTEPLRAKFDKQIPSIIQEDYASTMACNGNGACFSYVTQEAMCPSFKVTKERLHSPKGRATVMREWLRELANKHVDVKFLKTASLFDKVKNSFVKKDFSHEVYQAMNGCLSCKACTSQCPLNVDVPDIKSNFLEKYHQRYLRPVRDYLIASIESIASIQAVFPKLSNLLFQNSLAKFLIKKIFKLVDLPRVSKGSYSKLNDLSQESNKEKSVILLQDAFTSFYETDLLFKVQKFLTHLGFTVYVLPFFPNGKASHVKGFAKKFSRIAKHNIQYLQEIAKLDIPMLGIDPSITLTYRDEYQKLMGKEKLNFKVLLLQEWLVDKQDLLMSFKTKAKHVPYYLLTHCTEKTACVAAEKQWQQVFDSLGLSLQPLAAGCCGMAGTYGHELEHVENSKKLFSYDWERYINTIPESEKMILATGYSCRSQVKRLKDIKMYHPIELLLSIIFN